MGSGCRESEGAAEVEEASSGEHWFFVFVFPVVGSGWCSFPLWLSLCAMVATDGIVLVEFCLGDGDDGERL